MKRLNKIAIDVNYKTQIKECFQSWWRELLSEYQTEEYSLQAQKTQFCFQLCPIFFLYISQIKSNVITIIKQFQSVKFVGIAVILDLLSSDFRLTEHSGELH